MKREPKQRSNWPKTPLQWFGVLVLLFLAYSAWEAAINTTKDPFPELTENNREAAAGIDRLEKAIKDANKFTKENNGGYR